MSDQDNQHVKMKWSVERDTGGCTFHSMVFKEPLSISARNKLFKINYTCTCVHKRGVMTNQKEEARPDKRSQNLLYKL